jgi:hypothetical protein
MSNEPLRATPDQLIALLEKMCRAGFCATREHQGQQVYMLSQATIRAAVNILKGISEPQDEKI